MFDRNAFSRLSAEDRLKQTVYLIEASHFEQFTLWDRWAAGSKNCRRLHLKWEQSNGYLVTVGHLDKRPIVISMSWDIIEDHPVCFWEPTSELVDHKMIQNWFSKNYTAKTHDGRYAKTNADNFHHVTDELDHRKTSTAVAT